MKKYIILSVCALVALIVLSFIWGNSAQTGQSSGALSAKVQEIINDILHTVGIRGSVSHYFVRKAAHFSEYMVFSAASALAVVYLFRVFFKKTVKVSLLSALIALPMSAIVALTDEFVIQANTAGRGPRLTDVLIDLGGAATGVLLAIAAAYVFYAVRHRNANKNAAAGGETSAAGLH
ncbi:MAG: VanZ family protein [Ruminococcaceae bacterium]|nr:VanZ family protein [Oscillospiraceae bacterium]